MLRPSPNHGTLWLLNDDDDDDDDEDDDDEDDEYTDSRKRTMARSWSYLSSSSSSTLLPSPFPNVASLGSSATGHTTYILSRTMASRLLPKEHADLA